MSRQESNNNQFIMSPRLPSPEDYPLNFSNSPLSQSSVVNKSISDSFLKSPFMHGFSSLLSPRGDSCPSFISNTPLNILNESFVHNLHEKIGYLRRAVGIKNESVIYDSNTDGFDARSFNSKITCKTNIMILMMTGNSCIGCYAEDTIPLSKPEKIVPVKSKNMFLFYMENGSSNVPTLYSRKFEQLNSFVLCPDNDTSNFFNCYSAFCIGTDQIIHFKEDLYDTYEPNNGKYLFDDDDIMFCERFVALQWI
ncbi:TLDc domain-containing protein [Entamoeba marina]